MDLKEETIRIQEIHIESLKTLIESLKSENERLKIQLATEGKKYNHLHSNNRVDNLPRLRLVKDWNRIGE